MHVRYTCCRSGLQGVNTETLPSTHRDIVDAIRNIGITHITCLVLTELTAARDIDMDMIQNIGREATWLCGPILQPIKHTVSAYCQRTQQQIEQTSTII